MKINSILSIFAPSDVKFFPLLREVAGIVDKSSALLQELFAATEWSKIEELSRLIKNEESSGDKLTVEIFKALNATFITPFDREDITALTDEMDDVIDDINRVARKVILFEPKTFPPAAIEMTEIIRKGGAEIKAAVTELAKIKKTDRYINEHIKEIKRLEEEADVVYEKGISSLFKNEIRPEELIKLKEIIQDLEKSADKINSVGKILKTIIVKYS